MDGKIYILGGVNSWNPIFYSTVEIYDPVTDTWETLSDMPIASCYQAACALNQVIYIAGGGDPALDLGFSDFFEYDPACEMIPK